MNRVLLTKKLATLRSFTESMNSHENLPKFTKHCSVNTVVNLPTPKFYFYFTQTILHIKKVKKSLKY